MDTLIRSIPHIFCSISIIIVVILNQRSLQDSSLIIKKEAVALFLRSDINETCQIIDSYDGNLDYVNNSFESSQFSFLYLYANWCSRSQKYKELIRKLSCHYSNRISFIAVNCFNPTGSCEKAFNLAKYPNIFVQTRNVGLYNYQGPFTYKYIAEYLDFLIKPLTRIDNINQFLDFIIKNEVAIVGHFNFSNSEDEELYNIFYQSAIKTYNSNFENPIRYAVILNKTLAKEIFRLRSQIHDITDNDQRISVFSVGGLNKLYESSQNISIDSLTNWANMNVRRTLNWLYPDKFDNIEHSRKQLLIFLKRHSKNSDENSLGRELAQAKLISIENHFSTANMTLTNGFLKMIVDRIKYHSGMTSKYSYRSEKFWINDAKLCSKRKFLKQYISTPFVESFDTFLIDIDLYRNYAHSLMRNRINYNHNGNGNDSNRLGALTYFVDNKNETLYGFDKELSYKELKQFLGKQIFGTNAKISKTKISRSYDNFDQDINSQQVASSLGRINEKDVLIFLYSDWCGFCKIMNFKLLKVFNEYFKDASSLQFLRLNIYKNDLPLHLQTNKIPMLMLKPAESNEYFLYSNVDNLSSDKLINFILRNAKNPLTIAEFILRNIESGTKSKKLRLLLTDLISSRLAKLALKRFDLVEKISLTNDVSYKEQGHDNNLLYIKNINNILLKKLKKCELDIQLLKQINSTF